MTRTQINQTLHWLQQENWQNISFYFVSIIPFPFAYKCLILQTSNWDLVLPLKFTLIRTKTTTYTDNYLWMVCYFLFTCTNIKYRPHFILLYNKLYEVNVQYTIKSALNKCRALTLYLREVNPRLFTSQKWYLQYTKKNQQVACWDAFK